MILIPQQKDTDSHIGLENRIYLSNTSKKQTSPSRTDISVVGAACLFLTAQP